MSAGTRRRCDSGTSTSTARYADDLAAMLASARDRLGARLVLVEPFLTPVDEAQRAWREDLDPRIAVVRRLAAKHGAVLVPADGLLAAASASTTAATWCFDGVHPTPAGHGLLAEAWLRSVGVGPLSA